MADDVKRAEAYLELRRAISDFNRARERVARLYRKAFGEPEGKDDWWCASFGRLLSADIGRIVWGACSSLSREDAIRVHETVVGDLWFSFQEAVRSRVPRD